MKIILFLALLIGGPLYLGNQLASGQGFDFLTAGILAFLLFAAAYGIRADMLRDQAARNQRDYWLAQKRKG